MKTISPFQALYCMMQSAGSLSAADPKVGGQAIIEGVMMRSKENVSWAVRRADGAVAIERFPFISISKRIAVLGKPILRGAIGLYESLRWGLTAITRSAELAAEESDDAQSAGTKRGVGQAIANASSIGVALILSFGLFLYLPLKLLSFVIPRESALLYNFLAGGIRIVLFLGYLTAISLMKDIRRVFEYHGAEHRAIFAFEDGKPLTLDAMESYTTFHPRCGTSFLLLVALICIAIFAVIDALIIHYIGPYPTPLIRTLVHIAFIPAVSGTSYEVLRLSDKFQHIRPVAWLIQPGLWLQRITTRRPDAEQMHVAADALKAAL
jgi:uncharacterized protein YqhQ